MANKNGGWDTGDIDLNDIDFEDTDLDDLDFSVDGELNSIKDGVTKDRINEDLASIAGGITNKKAIQRPVRKVESKRYEEEFDDFDEEDEEEAEAEKPAAKASARREDRAEKTGGTGNSKLPIIILCAVIAVLIGALLFVLIKFLGNGSDADPTGASQVPSLEQGAPETTAAWSKDTEESVLDLVNGYYAALTLADTDSLRNILDESITVDGEKVAAEARVIEGYNNISCYTTAGQNEGEYVTYITFEIKFKNINTPAPGLIPVYIRTDEAGNLRLLTWESIYPGNTELSSFIAAAANCDAIRELSKKVETDYQNAKATDETLAEFLDSLDNTSTGEADTTASQPESETSSEAETTTEAGGNDGEDGEDGNDNGDTGNNGDTGSVSTSDFEEVDTMKYVQKNDVNARSKPDTEEDNVIESLKIGTYLQVTGKAGDWYRVCLPSSGQTAYVKQSFLGDTKPE